MLLLLLEINQKSNSNCWHLSSLHACPHVTLCISIVAILCHQYVVLVSFPGNFDLQVFSLYIYIYSKYKISAFINGKCCSKVKVPGKRTRMASKWCNMAYISGMRIWRRGQVFMWVGLHVTWRKLGFNGVWSCSAILIMCLPSLDVYSENTVRLCLVAYYPVGHWNYRERVHLWIFKLDKTLLFVF